MNEKTDYYEILSIERDAGAETIKRSYRELAMRLHPDKNPGDKDAEEKFKLITEAYRVLSDPEQRRIYDNYGHEGLRSRGGGGPGFGGASGFEDIFSGFSNIFKDFFGGGGASGGRQAPRKGNDLSYELDIDFEESYTGVEKVIHVPGEENCEACGGTGSVSGKRETCPHCKGQGQVFPVHGFIQMATTCPRCRGVGTIPADPCPECRGQGRIRKMNSVNVKVPAGIETGHRLRYQKKGDAGIRGGPRGDLYVDICVKHHEIFARDRNHVCLERKIDMVLAALGGEIEIPTVTGETKIIDVPAGSQNGKILRVEGLGFPNVLEPHKKRGDLVVGLTVATPKGLTQRQKDLLREFQAIEEEKDQESLFRGITRRVGEKLRNVIK
ncbi:MAG: molecular chaperone DnaJ [Deltaproteobacteria bacterium]|jgi:molecular chaperone DnaJ|nr:molecular chaperone DnaJ [Deltaproteobacteria bacterium]